MTITIIRSTDAGAPALTGQAGSLIAVLDFCLLTGGSASAIGWTKPFTGTNLAAYKSNVGNQRYLRIDDTVTPLTRHARALGYETLTAITPGGGDIPFPSASHQAAMSTVGGVYIFKSITTDATARQWIFVSNGAVFHLFHAYNNTTFFNSTTRIFTFGDFTSFKQGGGDVWNTFIMAEGTPDNTSNSASGTLSALTSFPGGHFIARSYTQTGGSTRANKNSDAVRGGGTIGVGLLTYPAPIEGGLVMAPIWIGEGTADGSRGLLPGLWNPCHTTRALAHGDTFTGGGDLTGRTFLAINTDVSGQIFVETSDTWD